MSKKNHDNRVPRISDSQILIYLRFDGETYQTAGSSSFSHKNTYAMANYMGSALTTGCEEDLICQVKTEVGLKARDSYCQYDIELKCPLILTRTPIFGINF